MTPRQAEIFDKILLGLGSQKIAGELDISLASVKSAKRSIREKIERETGIKPKDMLDMLSALIQMGEVSYNPK